MERETQKTQETQESTRSPNRAGDVIGDFLARMGMDLTNVTALPQQHPQYRECARHGRYPVSTRDPDGTVRYMQPVCPVCMAERAARHLMESAAIPKRYEDSTFDNYRVALPEQQAILDVCRDYADQFEQRASRDGSCLILCGNPGTGKNHLAAAIAREVLAKGYSVLQVTAHAMVARIRQTWRSAGDDDTELDVIRKFADVDLLIVDEIGKSFGSEGERVHLFDVIDYRYREMKPTLILSNEDAKGIERTMGEATFDRLCQNGKLLRFGWQSYRRSKNSD